MITKPHSIRKSTTKPNQKGKYMASYPEKTKKTTGPQISEVPKREKKLLSVASSIMKKGKVYFELLFLFVLSK